MPPKKTKATTPPEMATQVAGSESLRFRHDVAFDIETAPLYADHEDGALLNPETARVAAIGYYDPDCDRYIITHDNDEKAMLCQFWDVFRLVHAAGFKLLGFNICGFDLPFMVRRSWCHGVVPPKNMMTLGGRYWCDTFVDLMAFWKCGSYRDFISLDSLARFLAIGEKNGSGALFYREWETDRKHAIEYLVNDVRLTYRCAHKMGLVSPLSRV
jgi:hypothetical protein